MKKYKSNAAKLLNFDIEERRRFDESLYARVEENGAIKVWTGNEPKTGPFIYLGHIPSAVSGNSLCDWLEGHAESVLKAVNLAYDVDVMQESSLPKRLDVAIERAHTAQQEIEDWLADAVISPYAIASYSDPWDFLLPGGEVVDQVLEDVATHKFSSLGEWASYLAKEAPSDALVDPDDLAEAAELALTEWLDDYEVTTLEAGEGRIDEKEKTRVLLAFRLLDDDSFSVGKDLDLDWKTPPGCSGADRYPVFCLEGWTGLRSCRRPVGRRGTSVGA